MNCPSCQKPLTLAYELARELAIAECSNPSCRLYGRQATGESTKEAVEMFNAIAEGFEVKGRR